jgi:hypothetical protein
MGELFGNALLKRQWKRLPLEKISDRPILVAYGMGADSTSMLMGMHDRGIKPDAIVFADTGGEKKETYRYLTVIRTWLRRKGWPKVTVVSYKPKKFLRYPPYSNLEENCLSNGTVPGISVGQKNCSLKWKAAPQEKWAEQWLPAAKTWGKGQRIVKLIGFDASKGDLRRANHAGNDDDQKYEYRYPLQEWGWTRDDCLARIIKEGLPGWNPAYLDHSHEGMRLWTEGAKLRKPELKKEAVKHFMKARKMLQWIPKGGVPMKSACFYCLAMKVWEVFLLPAEKLRRLVVLECRALPRLHTSEGLWRKGTKVRPGSMTQFILENGLLPKEEIEKLQKSVPKELMNKVTKWRDTGEDIDWTEFFKRKGIRPEGFCGDFGEDQ